MKNYAKKNTHKGKTAYRTPSVFRSGKNIQNTKMSNPKHTRQRGNR